MKMEQDPLTVRYKTGSVKGSSTATNSGKSILTFRGIPYAVPPVGDLRFKRSKPVGHQSDIIDGTKESKKCLQLNALFPTHIDRNAHCPFSKGSEDCLYLNVYTAPNAVNKDDAKLPIVVFFHGGAFIIGSNEEMLYGPQILLERNLVMVGVNYRLGPLGFLSLQTDSAPGNLGLHDQYLALLWVQENISSFGGDPGNVTLMGQSAGSMSAMLHMVSPLSRGLFHRVIALSGTPSNLLLHNDRQPAVYARTLAAQFGCPEDASPEETLLCLQSQDAEEIVKKTSLFLDWDVANPMPWVPVVDQFCSQPFLPKTFSDAVKAGEAASVPVIMGICRDEGLIMSAPFHQDSGRWNLLARQWEQWAPLLFLSRERDLIKDRDKECAKNIKDFYFGSDTQISEVKYSKENLVKLQQMLSSSWFHQPWDEDSNLLASHGHIVYRFVLTHPPDFSLMDIFRMKLPSLVWMFVVRKLLPNSMNPYEKFGVCHGDDLCYLLPMSAPGFPGRVVSHLQKDTQGRLLDLVETMAKEGVPQISGSPTWEPLSQDEYLIIDEGGCKMGRDVEMDEQIQFWKQIREKLGSMGQATDEPIKTLYGKIAIKR